MNEATNPLELDPERLSRMITRARDRLLEHLDSLPEQHAQYDEDPEDLADAFHEPTPPREGSSFQALLDELFDEAIPASLNTAHPGYLAYIPGGGLPHSGLADLLADTTNRYVGTWFAAPALARLEANVVEWFCRIVDYPPSAFGVLTTGGSMANQIAITTARRQVLGDAFLDGTVYVSDQVHHSVSKSCVLAGIPAGNVRSVPTDDRYRMDANALEDALEEDEADGLDPFLIVANAGTTNTGAIDPLPEMATLADERDIWLHADAAYGGFFVLTDRGRDRLEGLSRADSITLDPHKGLFLPYGTGCLLVREETALERAHAVSADYIPDQDAGSHAVDFSQLSPELSRDFRGLRVWLPLKMHGLDPFRENLDEKLDLAEDAAERIGTIQHVTVLAPPQLSTLAFRAEPPGLEDPENVDAFNQRWLEAVNRRGNVHLSGTRLDEGFVLRVSVLSFRTHQEQIDACIRDLEQTLDALEDEHPPGPQGQGLSSSRG